MIERRNEGRVNEGRVKERTREEVNKRSEGGIDGRDEEKREESILPGNEGEMKVGVWKHGVPPCPVTYPYTLPLVALVLLVAATQSVLAPQDDVPHHLGGGDDVEGRGHRTPVLKVAHPQL